MRISDRTRDKICKFIKKNKVVYFSEVRALQKKKKGELLMPKVNFTSLMTILKELEKEGKIRIEKIGNMKFIRWCE